MVPQSYEQFFSLSAQAAAALVGLLFVAVAVAPERTIGRGAPAERQVMAESAFMALVNAFFVSLGSVVPAIKPSDMVVGVSIASLVGTVFLAWKLRPPNLRFVAASRRYTLIAFTLALYGLELMVALQMRRSPGDRAPLNGLVWILFGVFALGIARSWELLGSRNGIFGWFGLLREVEPNEGQPRDDDVEGTPSTRSRIFNGRD